MEGLTIIFKKIKNKENEYLIIFDSLYFPWNIIIFFELKIQNLIDFLTFINMLQNRYKISYFEIELDDKEIDMNNELCMIFNYPPF